MAARAVVFDVMGTLFDLGPARERLRSLGAPDAALEAWFGRLLHSATSLTLAGEFRPFRELAESTLRTALAQFELDEDAAGEVLEALGQLEPYPDVAAAFDVLEQAGIRIVTLTNGGEEHTRKLLDSAGLGGRVEAVLTVDEVGAYKPDPRPYRHAAERLALPPESLTLIAAHAWDVVGARAAGLDAVWVDRLERRWPFPTAEPEKHASGLEQAARLAVE